MADADTELPATMMLEGTVNVPDDDTIPTTETVQPEGDTECPGEHILSPPKNSPPKRKFFSTITQVHLSTNYLC